MNIYRLELTPESYNLIEKALSNLGHLALIRSTRTPNKGPIFLTILINNLYLYEKVGYRSVVSQNEVLVIYVFNARYNSHEAYH